MILHILTGGQVPPASPKLVGNLSQLVHLLRSHHTAGDLRPDHVDIGLTLAVYPAPQPYRAKLIVRELSCQERLSLLAEKLNVLADRLVVSDFLFGGHSHHSLLRLP